MIIAYLTTQKNCKRNVFSYSSQMISYTDSIFVILTFISPPGVWITTSSFNFLPRIPFAIGESFEIFPSIGFASALPTIV